MYFIGIDLGTSACKFLLMDERGEILNITSRSYEVEFPRPGWSQQDPADWWRAVREGVPELLAGFDASRVAGIGCGGQMHGLVALDASDPGDPPRDSLERRPYGRAGPPPQRGGGRPPAARAHGQHRLRRLHGAQGAVGARRGTRALRADRARHASQGLPEPPAHGRLCDRRVGRIRDTALRRGEAHVERRDARALRPCRGADAGASTRATSPSARCSPRSPPSSACPRAWSWRRVPVTTPPQPWARGAVGAGDDEHQSRHVRDRLHPHRGLCAGVGDRIHSFCHADGAWHLMGCILSAASCNAWWATKVLGTDDLAAEQADIDVRSADVSLRTSCPTSWASARRSMTSTPAGPSWA